MSGKGNRFMDQTIIVPRAVVGGLALAYALGLLGWIWDNSEHTGLLQTGRGAGPAHLMMGIGTLLALAALALALRRRFGRPLTYGWLAVGLGLTFVNSAVSYLVFLPMPVAASWMYGWRARRPSGFLVASAATAIVLVGALIDTLWHRANPAAQEVNTLFLPGHAIELAGWLTGFAATVVLLWQARAQERASNDEVYSRERGYGSGDQ